MKFSDFFGIFNHFIISKDPTQLLGMCNNLEIFSSKILGDGEVNVGEKAPVTFRAAVNAYAKSKNKIKLDVIALSETQSSGVIGVNLVSGRSKTTVVFSVLLQGNQLIAFVD